MKRKEAITVVCARCKKPFESTALYAKYCSDECAKWAQRLQKAEYKRRVRAAKEPNTYYCIRCGEVLPAGSSQRRLYCDACKKEIANQNSRERQKRYREKRKEQRKNDPPKVAAPVQSKPAQSIMDIMREIKEYNDTHEQSITYGQYVAAKGA